jgi:lysophospholipase L1-like esterase
VKNSYPFFDGLDGREYWVRRDDPHPNPAGHRLFHQALAEGLRELPASCWRRPGA